jgi:16S rRNA (adenine1518-N6/adenine1519-N6)-dimethyltransferase
MAPLPESRRRARDEQRFSDLVAAAFGQRRKTLRNALMAQCDAETIAAAGLRPDARAEQVPVAGFINLSNLLAARRSDGETA